MKRRKFLLDVVQGGLTLPLARLGIQARRFNSCWLDLAAPFIFEDDASGVHSEIVLTSDTFVGADGHKRKSDKTDYEILLYEADGRLVGQNVSAKISIPAMKTTTLRVADMIGGRKKFFGGMRIRLSADTEEPMHASDLFSSAFLRVTSPSSADNVHANPDPLQWQTSDAFFYSMPFPPMDEYACFYCLFNPYGENSIGHIVIYDPNGQKLEELGYTLKPHASMIVDVAAGSIINNASQVFSDRAAAGRLSAKNKGGGTLAVLNTSGTVKNFGYMVVRRRDRLQFSLDHPIHQPPYRRNLSKSPFDTEGQFRGKNILYTPILFNEKRIRGITLNTRYHLSSGAPLEESLWLAPFITDQNGDVSWQWTSAGKMPASIAEERTENGVIRLYPFQSCTFECAQVGLRKEFAGGFGLAISPLSNHTLMKVELTVKEWNAHAITHFRPGLAAARAYQKPKERGGLSTDYITSGARLEASGDRIQRDTIICVMNIDDKGLSSTPSMELFGRNGFIKQAILGRIKPFASVHYLLSDIFPDVRASGDLTIRLVDKSTTLIMSVIHIDFERKDICIDHGSDRFSTFQDFGCMEAALV